MFYYTYVLLSSVDQSIYIGYTENFEKRLKLHNSKQVRSTKSKAPFELIYFEGCNIKELAVLREKQLKTGFGRSYLKRRLNL